VNCCSKRAGPAWVCTVLYIAVVTGVVAIVVAPTDGDGRSPVTGHRGLIVLDPTNARPIVQTSFRSFPPAYPLLHISAYRNALAKTVRPEDVDQVHLVTLPDEPGPDCMLSSPASLSHFLVSHSLEIVGVVS